MQLREENRGTSASPHSALMQSIHMYTDPLHSLRMHVDLHTHTLYTYTRTYVHTHTRMHSPTVRHLLCPHADHRAHMFLLSSFSSVRSASLQSSPVAQVSRRRLRVVWLSSAPCGGHLTLLESQASCLFNLQQAGLVSGAFLGSRRLLGREPGAESKSRGIHDKEGRGRVGSGTCNGTVCSLGRVGPRTSNGAACDVPMDLWCPLQIRGVQASWVCLVLQVPSGSLDYLTVKESGSPPLEPIPTDRFQRDGCQAL